MKVAEALILRKQLVQKLGEINVFKEQAEKGFFKNTVERIKATDPIPGATSGSAEESGTDDIKSKISLLTADEVFKSHDEHATCLRKIDAAIQEANWANTIKDVKLPSGLE